MRPCTGRNGTAVALTRRLTAGFAALGLALLLAACSQIEPGVKAAAVPPAAATIPAEAPKTAAILTPETAEREKLVSLFGGAYRDPAAEAYLNQMLAKLAPASDSPGTVYHVTILNSPIVNAFAMPSGDLYATRGLLALANDSSELGAVMAHEIGHVTAGHAAQREEMEKRGALISQAATAIQSREVGDEVRAEHQISFASFSRLQEFEADQIGIRTIAKAGYDPYGAARFLASLERSVTLRASLMGQKVGSETPDLLSTHPSTPDRIAKATDLARQIGPPGTGVRDRDAYLNAINGLDFGDDPNDGFIRGTTFVHPRLGFTLTAPPGFVLENSSQAVLGIAGGGAQALRLDSVHVPSTTTLEAYLASGWIDGLDKTSVQTLDLNGLPAATATARGGEWSFRLAVVRLGTDVYRMIYAARSLTPDVDHRFRDSIGTFRRITTDEAASVRPQHIQVVTALPGDTADKMAARMAIPDQPLQNFLLLNGLENAGPLTVGQHYKLVAD